MQLSRINNRRVITDLMRICKIKLFRDEQFRFIDCSTEFFYLHTTRKKGFGRVIELCFPVEYLDSSDIFPNRRKIFYVFDIGYR